MFNGDVRTPELGGVNTFTTALCPDIEVEQKLSEIEVIVYVTTPVLTGVTVIGLPVIISLPFISVWTLKGGFILSVIVMLKGAEPVRLNPKLSDSPRQIWLVVVRATVGRSCTITLISSWSDGQFAVAAMVFRNI